MHYDFITVDPPVKTEPPTDSGTDMGGIYTHIEYKQKGETGEKR